MATMRIGILTGGGDCPGLNAVIRAVTRRALDRGERVRTPRNWLIKIAHNECRRLLSARKLHAELPDQLPSEPEEAGRAAELKRALDALPESQRQALVLRELEGRTYAEIAASLHMSVATAKTHVSRLLTKLNARDRAQLVVRAYEAGVVVPGASTAQES